MDATKPLLLIADTNLFFECQKLEELPWEEFAHDPITIIVTKPVLDEIDKHKKATGRTRDRALKIFKRFRAARKENQAEIIIKESSPRVLMVRRAACKPDKDLEDQLDYQRNDERLLGIVSSLAHENPQMVVMFLSHDEGPIGLAEELELMAHQIEDHWLRPQRQSDEQKEIDLLKSELAKHQENEPSFELSLDGELNERGQFVFTHLNTASLATDDINLLIMRLKEKHPMKTNFTPPAPEVHNDTFTAIRTVRTFSAPSSENIEQYQKIEYPEWIAQCTAILQNLHQTNPHHNDPFLMRFIARNVGSRPANKVRINFKAKGAIRLRRSRRDNDEIKKDSREVKSLPSVPSPPAFEISVVQTELENPNEIAQIGRGINNFTNDLAKIAGSMQSPTLRNLQNILNNSQKSVGIGEIIRPEMQLVRPFVKHDHNPEDFYYHDWPLDVPVDKGSLTCDLWRHSSDEKTFNFEVIFDDNATGNAAIECSIHAENLTEPTSMIVPVMLENKEKQITMVAMSLVDSSSI